MSGAPFGSAAVAGGVARRFAAGPARARWGRILALAILLGAGARSAAAGPRPEGVGGEPGSEEAFVAELDELYAARDPFALRDRLEERPRSAGESPRLLFHRLVVAVTFRRPDVEEALQALAAADPPARLAAAGGALEAEWAFARGRWARSWSAARGALADRDLLDDRMRVDLLGVAPLARALADVEPLRTEKGRFSRLLLDREGRIPVEIEGEERSLALDTGANLSLLARSEAEALGLDLRAVGVPVASSTGATVEADVAIAAEVRIGNARLRGVPFLVFPDRALAVEKGGGEVVRGLLGLPVVEALGAIRVRRDGVFEILDDPPPPRLDNVAIDGADVLVRARHAGDDLVCRLDTGAVRSVMYAPFFDRHGERIEERGEATEIEVGGVGGYRTVTAYTFGRLVMTVAAAGVELRRVPVYPRPLAPEQSTLDCNLGRDALERFRFWALDLVAMGLTLR